MKKMICILIACLPFWSMAQDSSFVFSYGNFTEGSQVFLFADKVNVREAPSAASKVIANLPVGYKLTVIQTLEEQFSQNGLSAPWVKVEFESDGKVKQSYIWGALISHASAEIESPAGSMTFVCTPVILTDDSGFVFVAKIVRGQKVIHQVRFPGIYTFWSDDKSFNYSLALNNRSGKGFSGVQRIFMLHYIYEACGYENGCVILFLTEKGLVYITQTSEVSEAGLFHVSAELMFPDDKGGLPNTIILKKTEENTLENEETEVKITFSSFVWDGNKITESAQ
jgi:hypothetical protein